MRHLLILLFALLSLSPAALVAQRTGNGRATAAPAQGQQRTSPPAQQTSPRSSDRSQPSAPRITPTMTERGGSPTPAPSVSGRSSVPPSQQQDYHPIVPKFDPAGTGKSNLLLNTSQSAKTVGSDQAKAPSLRKAPEAGKVNWMTLEQALEKSKTEKRKIFVDVYTDWCGWCKRMDSTTFVNPAVATYLNEHYYPVKFNAEQQQDVTLNGKTYKFKKSGSRGYHELAAEWLNNRLSYPTTVVLDESQRLIQPIPGFQDATKMETIINYFGGDNHKKTPWEAYERNFSTIRQ
ncbi:MAG TPA: DUF255 domain-containing protein [Saprospiraceae bacterium]|nr:DUF255 domain-containing protein [Saprospiraceae bacterium]